MGASYNARLSLAYGGVSRCISGILGAAWDLAFYCIPLAELDTEFAKDQLEIMLREWYMHPNGALPA